MAEFIINGGLPLRGEATISGAKNAALPMLSAALLTEEDVILHDCPRIGDVYSMGALMEYLGAGVRFFGNTMEISAKKLSVSSMPDQLSKKMRSSIFLLGSLISRAGQAEFSFPGGCEIGARPIDQHLSALERLGVRVAEEDGRISCVSEGLRGAVIRLAYPSVGATENIMLAAALAQGESVIRNAAREPEIEDLQNLLLKMGAHIRGAGTDEIYIEGVKRLHGAEHTCIPDRIEAGTFMAAAAATRGEVYLRGARSEHMLSTINALERGGMRFTCDAGGILAKAPVRMRGYNAVTMPYPELPTDMQPQLCAAAVTADGESRIAETVFESRMKHVAQLCAAGGNIEIKNRSAHIHGVFALAPYDYTALDLRGGAAFVIAALGAYGRSTVADIDHIDRKSVV